MNRGPIKKSNYSLKNKKRKKKSILPYILALLVVVVCVVLVIVCFFNKNNDNEETPITSSTETSAVDTTTPVLNQKEEFTFKHSQDIELVEVDGEETPQFINPLTGTAMDKDIANQRPVAIMINNIHVACPQEGISNADILYECLAEGGITRLEMLCQDYSSLEVVGSIRSSRKYFIDMAQNHDAIYVHAGGSDEAYSEIKNRNINHLDGVRADAISGKNLTASAYYRDSWRKANMGYEHSLMSTGELIANGISEMSYRTELSSQFNNPMSFVPAGYNIELNGESANYCTFEYRSNDCPEFEYNDSTKTYYRFQYGHEKHIDNSNKEQLNFTNVLILVMKHTNTGDEKSHINIETVGSGTGYLLTHGKYIKINWSRQDDDLPMTLTDSEGNPLFLNKGKTMINVISPVIEDTLEIK